MNLQELELAVTRLSAAELNLFQQWFDEFMADAWDRQIEEDIRDGRLDDAGRKANEDFEQGLCTPLFALLPI
jgi:hypothetical protein